MELIARSDLRRRRNKRSYATDTRRTAAFHTSLFSAHAALRLCPCSCVAVPRARRLVRGSRAAA